MMVVVALLSFDHDVQQSKSALLLPLHLYQINYYQLQVLLVRVTRKRWMQKFKRLKNALKFKLLNVHSQRPSSLSTVLFFVIISENIIFALKIKGVSFKFKMHHSKEVIG
jgi:hypothetical protein